MLKNSNKNNNKISRSSLLNIYFYLIILIFIIISIKIFFFDFSINISYKGCRGEDDLPMIFVITPTFTRPSQLPDMTRLAQTLMHIKNLFWIVVEDSQNTTAVITELLERMAIPHVQLSAARPKKYENVRKFGRGVANRYKII